MAFLTNTVGWQAGLVQGLDPVRKQLARPVSKSWTVRCRNPDLAVLVRLPGNSADLVLPLAQKMVSNPMCDLGPGQWIGGAQA
jgi:hypothetical protein